MTAGTAPARRVSHVCDGKSETPAARVTPLLLPPESLEPELHHPWVLDSNKLRANKWLMLPASKFWNIPLQLCE